MEPHSSTLAWRIPWMEEPGRLWSMGSRRVGHDWATSLSLFTFTFHFHTLEKEMATHSSVLAWRIPGTLEPGGLLSMGSHRVGDDWSDLAAVAAAARLATAFLPRSKHLLVSWLQSPSAVTLEPPKNKASYYFHCLPIYLPLSDGTRCHDLSFLNVAL